MLDLVGNYEDRFSRVVAHFIDHVKNKRVKLRICFVYCLFYMLLFCILPPLNMILKKNFVHLFTLHE